MEEQNSEVPLPGQARIRVGIVYNLKSGNAPTGVPDEEAEYDSVDTVMAIKKALERGGYDVSLIEDDGRQLPGKLMRAREEIDIAFNIAEGRGGRGREGQVPSLLGYLGIPYTGSDERALCVSLDKDLTKRIAASYGVKTPKSVLVKSGELSKCDIHRLKFPVIVKPNAEGSGKGIIGTSIAETPDALVTLLAERMNTYRCDFIVEEYIDGREFTVGLLGNREETRVLRPMEMVFCRHTEGNYNVYGYHVKCNYKDYMNYVCPARITPEQEKKLSDAALTVYKALGCRDFSRVDFRIDRQGEVYFLEINPLPGLAPGYSDFPMLAEASGIPYDDLIISILGAARKRLVI